MTTDFDLKKEFGDYQTPLKFAEKVCNYLKENLNLCPEIIVEPTCGTGNFLKASLHTFTDVKRLLVLKLIQHI